MKIFKTALISSFLLLFCACVDASQQPNDSKPEATVDDRQGNPLLLAIFNNDEALINQFISKNLYINETRSDGLTPLMLAIIKKMDDLAKTLILKGANINEATTSRKYIPVSGMTALMLSAESGNAELTKFLLSKGAQINSTDDRGITALMYAVMSTNLETVRILVEAGSANYNSVDANGYTAETIAKYLNQNEIYQYLHELKSNQQIPPKLLITMTYLISDRIGTQYKYLDTYFSSSNTVNINERFDHDFKLCIASGIDYIEKKSEGYKVSRSMSQSDQDIVLDLVRDCMFVKDWLLSKDYDNRLVSLRYFKGTAWPETLMSEAEIKVSEDDLKARKAWYIENHPEIFDGKPIKSKIKSNQVSNSVQNCKIDNIQNYTPTEFLTLNNTIPFPEQENPNVNKCNPDASTLYAFGNSICTFEQKIPANVLSASSLKGNGKTDVVMFIFQASNSDKKLMSDYFRKNYKEASKEYFKKNNNVANFYSMEVWKKDDTWIILGDNASEEVSPSGKINLIIGTFEGIKFITKDINTCK